MMLTIIRKFKTSAELNLETIQWLFKFKFFVLLYPLLTNLNKNSIIPIK